MSKTRQGHKKKSSEESEQKDAGKGYVNKTFTFQSKFKNQKQKELFTKILANRITFIAGAPGTGKTYIALMAALRMLKDERFRVNQVIITKPSIEAAKTMGHLPGTLEEKLSPYMFSFWSNLKKLCGQDSVNYFKANDMVKEVPLNYLRGNTFGHYDDEGNPLGCICVLDEAQNCTIEEMKMFISRMGEGTKLVIMGDMEQSDLKLQKHEKSGLEDAFNRFQNIPGIEFMKFTEDDIVRDPFLIEVMKRYKI
jgi:phosphate starvation-inducible PhoH-like protein